MTVKSFYEKFDQFSDAPNAVSKMRELVLRMATSGRLSKQDPVDGLASVIVDEIFEVRDQLINDGCVKNRVAGNAIGAGDTIELPASWVRCMISEVCDLQTGATPSRQNSSFFGGEIPWLVSGDINQSEITQCEGRITELGLKNSNCKIIPPNSVLIALNGQGKTRGTVAVLRFAAALNQSLVAMIPYSTELLLPEYIFWNLRGRYFAIRDITGQNQRRGLNMKLVGQLSLPIPPLAEQKRIVAKVDELMALCDKLEQQQCEREVKHTALARASLARFAEAPTPANLSFLFHKAYDISPAELRQSILTLAVRGKLVPQAQHDEAAIAIIQASRDYFQQLIAKKRISVPKALPPIKDEEIPFSLPSGWVWCRFGDLVRISSGDGLTTKQMIAGPIPVYGGNGITGYHNAYNVSQKTLVIGRVGFYCGSIHVTQTKAWVTDNAFVARFDEKNVSIEFLYWLLTATDLRKRDNSTAQPVISGAKIYPVILGIPPLAEQKRIVAKVDTLMAMVEKLETQISSRRDSAEKLLEAVVHELTNHN